jgi:hypothetical protein
LIPAWHGSTSKTRKSRPRQANNKWQEGLCAIHRLCACNNALTVDQCSMHSANPAESNKQFEICWSQRPPDFFLNPWIAGGLLRWQRNQNTDKSGSILPPAVHPAPARGPWPPSRGRSPSGCPDRRRDCQCARAQWRLYTRPDPEPGWVNLHKDFS